MRLLSAVIVSIALLAVPAAASADFPGAGGSLLVSSPGALGAAPSQDVNRAGLVSPVYTDDPVATSTDGRYSVFSSRSDGLSSIDDNRFSNVFRKDRSTGAIVLIAQSSAGVAANSYSFGASISNDGNLVAFTSGATNLAAADTDAGYDIFVRNVSAGTTTLVSTGGTDCPAPIGTSAPDQECGRGMIAGDGQTVAYASFTAQALSDNNNVLDVYRHPVVGGGPTLVSQVESNPGASGNGASFAPSIDDNGTHVAFVTRATNLSSTPAVTDGNGTATDVYVRTMASNDQQLVSGVDGSAAQTLAYSSDSAHISGNGLVVAFASGTPLADAQANDGASNIDAFLRTLSSNTTDLVSRATGLSGVAGNGYYGRPLSISDDGQWILFTADADNLGGASAPHKYNVYVRRFVPTLLGTTIAMSSGPSGPSAYASGGAISGDASRALIVSASSLDATPRDNVAEVYERTVSGPPGAADVVSRPSGSGAYAASDVGTLSTDYAAIPRRISADGRYVVFTSSSDGLGGSAQGPGQASVYRRDVGTGAVDLVSRADGPSGASADQSSMHPSISADGSRVAFVTAATNLGVAAPGDEVYVRDLTAQTTTLVSRADGAGGAIDNEGGIAEISGNGQRVAYVRTSSGGTDHGMVRDLAAQTTAQVDRADGPDGAVAPDSDNVDAISIDASGQRVAFVTAAKLDPADGDTVSDVYVRDLAAGTTRLASRADGAGGAKTTSSVYDAELSADGNRVAFLTRDGALAPEAGAWPANTSELVVRDLAAQTTRLVSRGAGGPADTSVGDYALDGAGDRIAFTSQAPDLVAGAGGPGASLFLRQTSTGETSALAVWHSLPLDDVGGVTEPGLSASGQCVAYDAQGVGPVSAVSPDFVNSYVMVTPGGTCPDPAGLVVPISSPPTDPPRTGPPVLPPAALTLKNLKVSSKRFTVAKGKTAVSASVAAKKKRKKAKTKAGTRFSFTLSARAAVTVTIERKAVGRRKGAKCVAPTKKLAKKKTCALYVKAGTLKRAGLKAGANTIAFSGRIGARALKPGAYRATVVAAAGGASSSPATVTFAVVRR